jgi:hypothetical protein
MNIPLSREVFAVSFSRTTTIDGYELSFGQVLCEVIEPHLARCPKITVCTPDRPRVCHGRSTRAVPSSLRMVRLETTTEKLGAKGMKISKRRLAKSSSGTIISAALAFLSWLSVPAIGKAQCSNTAGVCEVVVPHLIKFSGAFTNAASVPRSTAVSVRFVIYGAPTGGTPLWQEVQNVRLDQQGHYEVMLGATENDGIPMELFTGAEQRWLGVQPLVPGEEEQPRVLLVSVPYAMEAADAQKLGGLPASAFAKVAATAEVGNTSNVPATLNVAPLIGAGNGVVPAPATPSGQAAALPVTTTGGTANSLAKFSGASSLVNSQIIDQNGMVGMQNLANILFADQFAAGVPAAVSACPSSGCVIYAVSPNVNLNLGTIDPGSKRITIYLGPFTYTVNQITLRNSLKIIGMGASGTVLQSVNGNNPVFVLPQTNYSDAADVTLSGFHLKGSAGNTSEDAFFLDTSSTFSSGLWYSTLDDIYMEGFAGIALHIRGPNNNFGSLTQWVRFSNIVVFRTAGGGNGLRLEGGVFELRFVNCEFDGAGIGDGTNIYLGGLAGGISGYPWSIAFEGLVSQQAALAVQIDGGLNLTFYGSHHETLWAGYQINATHGIWTEGVTISDASFANTGVNAGAGYILNITTTLASQINFSHNQILNSPDSIVKNTNLASVVYQDNGSGGTTVPVTSGITTSLAPAATVNIMGVHSVALAQSTTPITTIQSSLGPGETVTFLTYAGPVTFASGGNINLMGANTVTVNGSITFVRNDLSPGLEWTPVSQWSPMR